MTEAPDRRHRQDRKGPPKDVDLYGELDVVNVPTRVIQSQIQSKLRLWFDVAIPPSVVFEFVRPVISKRQAIRFAWLRGIRVSHNFRKAIWIEFGTTRAALLGFHQYICLFLLYYSWAARRTTACIQFASLFRVKSISMTSVASRPAVIPTFSGGIARSKNSKNRNLKSKKNARFI